MAPSTAIKSTTSSSSEEERRRRRALLSWRYDFISCTAILLLLFCWLFDIINTTTATTNDSSSTSTILSKSFLEHGFCLSPQLFDNTHFSCAAFDFMCACVCIVAIIFHNVAGNNSNSKKKKKNKSVVLSPGSAIYFLAHSYGHYIVSQQQDQQPQTITEDLSWERIQKVITLAAILSIGPIDAASTLIKAKKLPPQYAHIMASILLIVLVGMYEVYLSNNPSYALLYINISIILSRTLPKLLFVGYTTQEDVTIRSSSHNALLFSKIVSGMVVIAVIICEPFFCDVFFDKIGGHFLFDLSLALDVVAAVMVEQQQRSGGSGVDDDEEEKGKVKQS